MFEPLLSVLGGQGAFGVLADLPEPTHTPGEVRETADEILSRPEYQDAVREPSWFDKAAEAVFRWIGDLFESLLGGTTIGGALPDFVGILILVVLVGGVAALLVWAASKAGFSRVPRRRGKRDSVFVDVAEYRTVHQWLKDAEEHERAGRWREGLLCRYRALVTDLVDRKVIPDVPGRTAGEYVQDMRVAARSGDVAPTFAAATELFEAAWYGGADTGAEERDRFAGLAERVLAGVMAAVAASASAVAAAAGSEP